MCENHYRKKWLTALFPTVWVIFFTLNFSFFFSFYLSRIVASLGTWQRRSSYYGNSATELPGQRPRGRRDGSEEVHWVLHLCAVFHHAGRRPPQPAQSTQDTRGQWVAFPTSLSSLQRWREGGKEGGTGISQWHILWARSIIHAEQNCREVLMNEYTLHPVGSS